MDATTEIAEDIYHFYRKLHVYHELGECNGGGGDSNGPKPPDEWPILLRLDDHIEFVVKAANRAQLPDNELRKILHRVKKVNARCLDPCLYAAIVGPFGCGKSSFINTLLRKDFLKTSFKVATATETQIRHSSKLDAKVEFHNRPPIRLRLQRYTAEELMVLLFSDYRSRLEEISRRNRRHDLEKNLTDFVRQHTECGELAESVSRVTLYHPSKFLDKGLVLIDTPGLDADNSGHAEITRHVVEEVADVALVLINAVNPVSQDLVNFLNMQLKGLLRRCIFIVTQIDKIPPEEREQQVSFIRDRLIKVLGYSRPDQLKVYACSSLKAFKYFKDNSQHSDKIWAEQFLELEEKIKKDLSEQKISSRISSLVKLMKGLLKTLKHNLVKQGEEYNLQADAVAREFIQDFENFAQKQRRACRNTIERRRDIIKDEADDLISRHYRQLVASIDEAIGRAQTRDDLRSVARHLKDDIAADIADITEAINKGADRLKAAHQEAIDLFYRRLHDEYSRISRITSAAPPEHFGYDPREPDLDVGVFLKSIDNFVNQNLPAANWLDIPLDFFKNFILGVDKLQNQLKVLVHDNFKKIYKKLSEDVEKWLSNEYGAVLRSLDQYVHENIKKFEPVVIDAKDDLEKRKEKLLNLKAEVESDLNELDKRLHNIQRFTDDPPDVVGDDPPALVEKKEEKYNVL